ncbi:uncharacterized protein LOC142537646 [Primulina tabacum]|uniref:uncharacterized protein LOC142537646 n=1 Tax=Primulina tabacum TaxID=48773 RepID=UPI003F59E05D
MDGKKKAEFVRGLHEKAKANIEKKNEQYAKQANKGKKKVVCEKGDWVWLHLKKERFPEKRPIKNVGRPPGSISVAVCYGNTLLMPGFGNSMNHQNYAPRGPYQPFPAEYWQNMSHPYFTPPVVHGYSTPHTNVMPFTSPISNEPATPTFVPETQIFDRESPIEVVNLEKMISNAEGSRKRSSWTKIEDEVLARSFVTINDDPIIGNDQKADAFWGSVASYYNENRPSGSNTRSANVIRDIDFLRFAYEKYRSENNGVAFNLEHVWRTVKDRPMFTPQSADHYVATKKTKSSESGASNTSSNQDVSIDLDDEDTRPMGQKAAKRKGKDRVKSTIEDLTVNYNNVFAKFTEYTSVKKSEVDLKQKQLEVEEIKAKAALSRFEAKNRRLKLKEYEILNKDISQMTEEQLIIHECLCQDIRLRWNI